jgi:p-aminobenzoyl-glutamate transporter AbgT
MAGSGLQGRPWLTKIARALPPPAWLCYLWPMNDILVFCAVLVGWFVVVRFVFPRLGIRG